MTYISFTKTHNLPNNEESLRSYERIYGHLETVTVKSDAEKAFDFIGVVMAFIILLAWVTLPA